MLRINYQLYVIPSLQDQTLPVVKGDFNVFRKYRQLFVVGPCLE